MLRRSFLSLAGPIFLGRWTPRSPSLRYVLTGGRWFGNGVWQSGDLGIDSSGRLRLRPPGSLADSVIDLTGRIISPGFIDILADNSSGQGWRTFETYKVSDGVTTALQMHGGSAQCGAFYQRAGAERHLVNHGVSTFVMAIRARYALVEERLRRIERNLAEGALGVSHSLEYQPVPHHEMLAYAKLARRWDRPLFLHLRYSSPERELDGVREAVRLAEESGARVHVAHLHSTGGTWHMAEALELLRAATARGLVITTCVYPYSFWATYLGSRRFDPGWRERYGLDYHDLRIVGTGERLTAASFAEYRTRNPLVAVPEGTMPLDRTYDLAIGEDFCGVGSDGGIQFEKRANSHPRGAGCFASAIRRAMETGMPLERIVEKLTAFPSRIVRTGLERRGVIEEGAIADLTVFDPAAIRSTATLEEPNRFSSGIDLVFVSGELAYRPGELGASNGKAVRA
jgi:N-acyl-D-aspartate/D-glutamate deacylase